MADGQQEQDRTEPATPFKLEEAKRQGQVSKSIEINSLLVLGMGLILVYAMGSQIVARDLAFSRWLLASAGSVPLESGVLVPFFSGVLTELSSIFWFVGACVMSVAVLANLVQTGPVFSSKPLKPDFKRLDPSKNLKKFVNVRILYEIGKTLFKMALFTGVAYLAIDALLPYLQTMMDKDPVMYPNAILSTASGLAAKLLLALVFVALIDLFYTRYEYAKKMRMSHREIKEERKRREGDPHVRAKMRELQREAAQRAGSIKKVPEADVLITNPTRLAVALRYERGEMAAPIVTAKGAGDHAAKMREIARKSRVPIVEEKTLARGLFRSVAVDQAISEDHYAAVARILARVFAARAQSRSASVEA